MCMLLRPGYFDLSSGKLCHARGLTIDSVVSGKRKPFESTGLTVSRGALQVEPGLIWCFEQEQSLAGINVVTTVRMTVVKLQNGELLVYAPIAPTRSDHRPATCL